MSSQLPHGRKAFGSLSHPDGTTGVQHIEAVAQLQQVLVAGYGQLFCQQVVSFLQRLQTYLIVSFVPQPRYPIIQIGGMQEARKYCADPVEGI